MIEVHTHIPKTAADARAAIDESNHDLRVALEELELQARHEMSLGRRIAENAPAVLTLTLLCGVLLGALTRRTL